MTEQRTEGMPKGKPDRADHVVFYALDKVAWVFKTLRLDHISGNLRTTDAFHAEVHEGEAFNLYNHTADGADIADNAEINVVFTVPAGLQVHLTGEGQAGGLAELWFGEASNVSGGTPTTPIPFNSANPQASEVTTCLLNATIGSFTVAYEGWLMGGVRQNASGADIRANAERVLGPGTYAVRLFNRAGGLQPADIRILWYEEH